MFYDEQKFDDEEQRFNGEEHSEELFDEELNKALEEAEGKYEAVEVQYVNIMWIIPTNESWQDKQIKALVIDLPMLQNKNQAQTKNNQTQIKYPGTSPAMVLADTERRGMFYVMYVHPAFRMQLGVGYSISFKINKLGQIVDFERYDLTKRKNIMQSIQKLKNRFLEELKRAYAMRPETWRVLAEYYKLEDSVFDADDLLPDF